MKKPKSLIWTIVSILVAAAVWFVQNKFEKDTGSQPDKGGELTSELKEVVSNVLKSAESNELKGMLTVPKYRSGEFKEIDNCKLLDHKWNDGDSFYVDNGKSKIHYRLYFVDTAESAYKTYKGGDNNGDRLDEQGEYFGGLSRDYTAATGVAAKKFVLNLLSKNNFTIFTKSEPVTNRSDEQRVHAFVIVDYDGKPTYLHELLVAKGLVRIKTRGAALPVGRDFHDQRDHIKKIEVSAQKKDIGIWSLLK